MQTAVFLAVHRILDRESVISLCVGVGIEIGPGPRPQILPNNKVKVSYIEQKLPHEWAELYGEDYATPVDPNLWKMFIVGDADNLPVENNSLDFIFSSHVFEHLANPLGHLELWLEKLRPGGKVVAIIPDISGSKDQRAEPSSLDIILSEYTSRIFKPSIIHYDYFLAIRKNVKDNAKALMEKGRSIHVHYYDNQNISIIMNEAKKRFNINGYSIVHTRNHKDFYLIIEKR
jgi:SAM-dependent methyltransferase